MNCIKVLRLFSISTSLGLSVISFYLLYQPTSPIRNQSQCYGHFHLCAYKRMIIQKKLYGDITFPSDDIYNFSGLTKFRTQFFKVHPEITASLTKVKKLRHYIREEFRNTVLNKTLVYKVLNKTQTALKCSFRPYQHFNYTFHFRGTLSGPPMKLLFEIEEKFVGDNRLTDLLPSIHGNVSTTRTKAVCETMGYADNKYYLQCPLLEPTLTISFWGSYRAPSIDSYVCNKADNWHLQTYTTRDLENLGLKVKYMTYPDLPQSVCSVGTSAKSFGFWLRLDSIWHFATLGCYFPFSFNDITRKCLHSKHILMIGDSHMGYRYKAMVRYHLFNASMEQTTVASEMVAGIKKHILKITTLSPFVLILNSGHWSLRQLDVATYLSDMTEAFELIQTLKARNPSLHVIWIESTALTYNEYTFRGRITFLVAAMNDWVNFHMRKLGVDIIPAFDISLPMQVQTRDGSHYQELLEEDVLIKKDKVSVGGAIDSVLIHTICPNRDLGAVP